MIQYAQENSLVLQASSYMFPPLRRNEQMVGKNNRFTPEEASRVAAEIVRLQNGEEKFHEYVELLRKGEKQLDTDGNGCLGEDLPEEILENVQGDRVRCSAGRCAFWLTWDGRMLPCGMMIRPEAYPFQDGFKDAWKKINDEVEAIRLPAKCAGCPLKKQCQSCAAMVQTETDTFTEVPEYRCRMTHCYLEQCERLLEETERRQG